MGMSLLTKLQPLLTFLCFLILSICGAATTSESSSLGLFITILILSLLGGCYVIFQNFMVQKMMKSRNSYEINTQSQSKKDGVVNAAFDTEKGQETKGGEKWAANYVPYGHYPGVATDSNKEREGAKEGGGRQMESKLCPVSRNRR